MHTSWINYKGISEQHTCTYVASCIVQLTKTSCVEPSCIVLQPMLHALLRNVFDVSHHTTHHSTARCYIYSHTTRTHTIPFPTQAHWGRSSHCFECLLDHLPGLLQPCSVVEPPVVHVELHQAVVALATEQGQAQGQQGCWYAHTYAPHYC